MWVISMKRGEKKAFISLYVLLILLALALTISFIYKENQGNFDNATNLYNKKVAMFEAESLLNISVEEIGLDKENLIDKENRKINLDSLRAILSTFDSEVKFSIIDKKTENEVREAEGARTLNINAIYEGTISYAIMVYKIDQNANLEIIYKKVY